VKLWQNAKPKEHQRERQQRGQQRRNPPIERGEDN
jgi:hypothetical protein